MARKKRRSRGAVFKRGSIWWIRYSHNAKEYRESTGRAVREAAEILLAKRHTEIFENRFDVRRRCELTLQSLHRASSSGRGRTSAVGSETSTH